MYNVFSIKVNLIGSASFRVGYDSGWIFGQSKQLQEGPRPSGDLKDPGSQCDNVQ